MKNQKLLQQTLWDLQKRFGDQVIGTLAQQTAQTGLQTGFPTLDALLGSGGIPRGNISVLIGIPTCGITTLALQVLASAQGTHEAAVYLDLSGTFDVDYATLYGVAPDRLLVVEPYDPMQALEIARDLAKSERASLLVIDFLGVGRLQQMNLIEPLQRLHEHVRLRTAVIFLLPTILPPLDPLTHTCLMLEHVAWRYQYDEVSGYQVRVTVQKHKPNPPGQTLLVDFVLNPQVEGGAE